MPVLTGCCRFKRCSYKFQLLLIFPFACIIRREEPPVFTGPAQVCDGIINHPTYEKPQQNTVVLSRGYTTKEAA